MPLKLSSSPLSIKSETLKSPKIGKRNYILKTELSSLKVHTPSVNQNENPLFNYYNFSSSSEQNCNTILNIDEPHSYDYKEENVYNSQSNNQTNDSSGKNFYKDESDGSFRSMPSSSQNENKIHNVTTITEENDVIIKHFLDSVLPYKEIPNNAKIIDIGSGAGFPSIPLKIMNDSFNITPSTDKDISPANVPDTQYSVCNSSALNTDNVPSEYLTLNFSTP